MRRHSLMLFAIAAIGLAATQASAADLPRKAPAYLPPPPPPFVWTGCYIGANVGGAWGHVDATDVSTGASVSPSKSGFAGGGQIGCDYQMGAWVIGIRNLFDGTSISGSRSFSDTLFTGTANGDLHWFDALTARGGYLIQPNLLFYVQGGAAWTQWDVTFINSAGTQVGQVSNSSRTGWTLGGGAEWMFVPHWSVFLEYNFMGFGTRSSAFTACGVATCANISARSDLQNVLLGVNYRF
jgi:outer membrane immunogenic protein